MSFKSPLILTSLLFFMVLVSCNRQESKNVEVIPVEIERFDREMFESDPDTLDGLISTFYKRYPDFFEIYCFHVLGIGTPGEKDFPVMFRRFLEDGINREVYREVSKTFNELGWLEDEFGRAFGRFKKLFPGHDFPRVVSFVSRFSYPYFSVEGFIGTGLDMYLGSEHEFYNRLGLPEYQRITMIPERIAPDAVLNWANGIFTRNDSVENVLSYLIHEGKMLYMLESLFPDAPDSLLLGFRESQMEWCEANEQQMWIYLIENELLFSGELMDIRKLTGPGPFTPFFSGQSPGRAATWNGLQLIRNYMKRNPDTSLEQLMNNHDYQAILRESRYDP